MTVELPNGVPSGTVSFRCPPSEDPVGIGGNIPCFPCSTTPEGKHPIRKNGVFSFIFSSPTADAQKKKRGEQAPRPSDV